MNDGFAGFMPVLAGVGLATAQGSAEDVLAGNPPLPPSLLPWPAGARAISTLCRPVRDLDPAVPGATRWRALAQRALVECCPVPPPSGTPLVIASCNGGAESFGAEGWQGAFDAVGTVEVPPWNGVRLPVVSAACASGLHALFLARRLLEGGADEVVVLAVDILSAASQRNFEALRILSPGLPEPWQPQSEGFLTGEGAVALHLRRRGDGPRLRGPMLCHDLGASDGLHRALGRFALADVGLVLAQGTGPVDVDAVELEALRHRLGDLDIPLTTPLDHFGHTLAASGLLSLALATLARRHPLPSLMLPPLRAADGRRLVNAAEQVDGHALVVCRALGGACAVVGVGDFEPEGHPTVRSTDGTTDWADPVALGPLHHPFLRALAAEAFDHRPPSPPDLLVVRLVEPLLPPDRAVLGGRLLPSAVLEITPGFAALLIARAWGFTGPTLCLVGPRGVVRGQDPARTLWGSGLSTEHVHVIYLSAEGNHVDWN